MEHANDTTPLSWNGSSDSPAEAIYAHLLSPAWDLGFYPARLAGLMLSDGAWPDKAYGTLIADVSSHQLDLRVADYLGCSEMTAWRARKELLDAGYATELAVINLDEQLIYGLALTEKLYQDARAFDIFEAGV